MNKTISNEQRATRVLAKILEVGEANAAKQKDVSFIEYDLIKTFSDQHPELDMHSKLGFAPNDIDSKAVKALLNHSVAVPMGFASPANDLTATKLRDAVNRQTAHIIKGGAISDDTLTNMTNTLAERQKQYEATSERLDNYKAGNYEKGMVNPIEMKENYDAGKPVFKSGHHLLLAKGYDKDGRPEMYAVERKMGIQSTHASIDYPSNDLSFIEVHGSAIEAKAILAVVGDTENKTYAQGKANGIKQQHTVNTNDAVALSLLLEVHQKDPYAENLAVVSVDTRNFGAFVDKIEKVNPNASLSVYTNNRMDKLSMIGNDGKQQAIPSVFEQVETLVKEKRFANNPNKPDIQLLVARSNDSLVDTYNKVKESVKEAHPDDPSALFGRLKKVSDFIVDDLKANGNSLTERVKDAYHGLNAAGKYDQELSVTDKAAFESRRNQSINTYGDNNPKQDDFRPQLETIQPDSIDHSQPNLLEGNKNKPEPRQLAASSPRI